MIFGIDLDGTYAADVETFRRVVQTLYEGGHRCVLVTNREGSSEDRRVVGEIVGDLMPALFCNGRPKYEVALEAGYDVDVWVDDNPVLVDFGEVGLSMVRRGQR